MYTPERSQTEVFADNLSRILKKSPACCKRKASSGADERTRT